MLGEFEIYDPTLYMQTTFLFFSFQRRVACEMFWEPGEFTALCLIIQLIASRNASSVLEDQLRGDSTLLPESCSFLNKHSSASPVQEANF